MKQDPSTNSTTDIDPMAVTFEFARHGQHSTIPLISHIEDNLYLGGCRGAGIMELPQHLSHVVGLSGSCWYDPHPATRSVVHHPVDDSRAQPLDSVFALAHWVNALPVKQNVLVHCQMGINRSGALMARVLMLRHHCSADEAITLLRRKRSTHVLFNESFVEQLRSD